MKTFKTAAVEPMRVAWRTVGPIAAGVVAEAGATSDPFALTRTWIGEISYRCSDPFGQPPAGLRHDLAVDHAHVNVLGVGP